MVAVIVSLLVGLATVVQGGLNKFVSMNWGVHGATLFNSFAVLITSAIAFVIINYALADKMPAYMKIAAGFEAYKWWYWIPAICGTTIVLGIPIGIIQIGALNTLTIIICAQIVFGILWDIYVEKLPVNTMRAIGAAFTVVGAILVTLKTDV